LANVVDELLNENRLSHARAAEEADLAATPVGSEQSMTLIPVSEESRPSALLGELGRIAVDRKKLRRLDRTRLVDRPAHDVGDAAEHGVADRHHDGAAGIGDFHAAHQTVVESIATARTIDSPRCLRHFEHQVVLLAPSWGLVT